MAFGAYFLVFSSLFAFALARGPVTSVCTPKLDINTSKLYIKENGTKYIISSSPMSWFAAMTFCNRVCAKMLTLETPAQGADVAKFLNSNTHKTKNLWLSGNNLADMKSFHWGFEGAFISYSNWKMNQPDNAGNKQHCMVLTPLSFQWDDEDCYRTDFHAICKFT